MASSLVSLESSRGGYDYQWQEEPPDELKCMICLCIARNPMQHDACGRIFCQSCITEYQRRSDSCPNCRGTLTLFRDARSARHVQALKVRCSNSNHGCPWVGQIADISQHDQSACKYSYVACTNECKTDKILKKDLADHLQNLCPRRLYNCPNCDAICEFQDFSTKHLPNCQLLPMKCPNKGCTATLLRCELPTHRDTCGFEQVSCKYAHVGCSRALIRRDLPAHENDYQSHLQTVIQTVLDLKSQQEKRTSPPIRFRVTNFSTLRSSSTAFHSPSFYTSQTGYRLSVSVYCNGRGESEGTHVAVYANVMRGDNDEYLKWPFTGVVTFELLNQIEDAHHVKKSSVFTADIVNSKRVKDKERGVGYGHRRFIAHTDLSRPSTGREYLQNDTLVFRVSVDVPDYKPWLECTV